MTIFSTPAAYTLDLGGLGGFVLLFFGAILLFLVVNGLRQRGGHRRVLEWDPVQRVEFQAAQEDVDLAEMLALHNASRAREGLPPLTVEEYREQTRRNGG